MNFAGADVVDMVLEAAQLIADADSLVIMAGAGMSTDSGMPDYRGQDGFWRAYPALAKAKISFIDMANHNALLSNPTVGWGFYGHQLNLYRKVVPHVGYEILHRIASSRENGFFVYTSNIDGHFTKAGFDHDRIVECHGSIHHLQCSYNCGQGIWDAPLSFIPVVDEAECRITSELPTCPSCGKLARPNVMLFHDHHYDNERSGAQRKNFDSWFDSLPVQKPVIVEIGAGTAVSTVRMFGASLHVPLIRINKIHSEEFHQSTISIQAGALDCLSAIQEKLLAMGIDLK